MSFDYSAFRFYTPTHRKTQMNSQETVPLSVIHRIPTGKKCKVEKSGYVCPYWADQPGITRDVAGYCVFLGVGDRTPHTNTSLGLYEKACEIGVK